MTDIETTVADFKDVDMLMFLNRNPAVASFSMHENVVDLVLENCKLRDNEFAQICKEMGNLRKLRNVNFSRNEISAIGMEYFGEFMQNWG